MAKCDIMASNGKISKLAQGMAKAIPTATELVTIHSITKTDDFKAWYGDGALDDNQEPVLIKQRGSKPKFVNENKEELSIYKVKTIFKPEPVEEGTLSNEVISDIYKQLVNKKAIIERKNLKDSNAAEKATDKIDDIINNIKSEDNITTQQSLLQFFDYAFNEVTKVARRAENIIKNNEPLQNLSYAVDYVNAFQNANEIFQQLKRSDEFDENPFGDEFYNEVIMPIITGVNTVKNLYKDYAATKTAEKLFQVNQNSDMTLTDIRNMLFSTTGDVSYAQYMLDAMATSPDAILALVDKLVKNVRLEIREEMTKFKNGELKTALLALEEEQRLSGVNVNDSAQLYDFMLNKNKKGELDGTYKTPEELIDEGVSEESAKYKFAKMFHENYQVAQSTLPETFRKNNQIITILKNNEEKVREKGLVRGTIQRIKESVTINPDDVDKGSWEVYTDENDSEVKFIPIHYTATIGEGENQVSANDVSLDMANSLQLFMTMSKNHNKMSEIVPVLEATKTLMSERKVNVTEAGKNKFGKALANFGIEVPVSKLGVESNAYKMYVEYLDTHVYGEYTIPLGDLSIGKLTVNKDKLLESTISYTAMNSLSFNVFSGINNLAMGNIMNGLEGNSGMFFTKKELNKARADYFKNLPAFMKDVSGRFVESELGLFMEQFDIYQEFNEFGEPLESKSALYRMGGKTLDWMLKSGEHMIQTTHAMAFMNSHKIDKDGKILSYYEWLEDNNFENNKDNRKAFDELKSVKENLKKNAEGVMEIEGASKEETLSLIERIKGNYQWNHGNYSKQDYVALNRRWFGKLLLLFRKWLKPGWDRRFKKEYYDHRMKHDIAGNYAVTAQFWKSLTGNIGSFMTGMTFYSRTAQFKALPEWKKAQVIKTYREIYLVAALSVIASFLMGMESDVPEDERSFVLNMSEFLAHRLNSEMKFFVNPSDAMRILKSPTATMGTYDKIRKTLDAFITGDVYKAGERKGDAKAPYYAQDLIPVFGKIKELWEVDEVLKFQRQ
jgi:hypothetical protein